MARTLHGNGERIWNDTVTRSVQRLVVAQQSDVGRKRSNNEDCIAADALSGLLVVADGVGGYRSGEVASAIAVGVIVDEFRNDNANSALKNARDLKLPPAARLQAAIAKANEKIFYRSQEDPNCNGMGTTVVAALFVSERIIVAHAGDSRLYRFREERLEQLTTDHSLVQELQALIANGTYSSQTVAAMHAPRNLVTRALGIEATVAVDIVEHETRIGDLYLLCSDGLSDMVDDSTIHKVVKEHDADIDEAARRLVDIANANGGKDNVSVILAKVLEVTSKPD